MLLTIDGKVSVRQAVYIEKVFVNVLDVAVSMKGHSEAVFSRVLGRSKHKRDGVPVLSDLCVLYLFFDKFKLDRVVLNQFEQLVLSLSVGV